MQITMRKLIILFVLLSTMLVKAQQLSLDKTFRFTKDTAFTLPVDEDRVWGVQVDWDTLNALDSKVEILQSNTGVNYNLVSSTYTNTMTDTTGSISFDYFYISHAYMRIKFTANSVTSGKIRLTVKFKGKTLAR